ncbi:serine/threonine protein phosphatase [Novosphingobium sp. PC22D]|uniref:PP2C family protein-serine/threonine phosphatase n=1 Tax=Novosphingobium sp. PC22D TaxID=1962403 RepID=UPI000BF1D64E|nr:protein phosphatase 2C domain-containing protein [Novosphingobium sp. PC22D]PEQ13064.1 serine/threonine protein phosphatase [Novosphingobium sp. PC22D]
MPFKLDSAAVTHEGCVRERNEDTYCERTSENLWAVADGMGGHDHGDWASEVVTQTLMHVTVPEDFEEACYAIANSIHVSNQIVYTESVKRSKQMGTTVVALYFAGPYFGVCWVGDSRAYVLRDNRLIRLTKDHTPVQELLDRGAISEEEAETHPMRHMLGRAVGVRETVEVDIVADRTRAGDIFLLCSDGLHGQVSDSEIEAVMKSEPLDKSVDMLLEMTISRGAPDNVTMVAVSVDEETALSLQNTDEGSAA